MKIEDRNPDDRTGPLSYGQRALWFLQQLAPNSAAYNVVVAARIKSCVEIAALRRAFQMLVTRHPCLRTSFPAPGGEPIQYVHAHREVALECSDASLMSSDELKARMIEESHRPFNLEEGPLLRVSLFTKATDEHALLIAMHHIIVDFLSLVTILDDLRAFLAPDADAASIRLPDLRSDYLDFAKRQADMLAGPEGAMLWQYWKSKVSAEIAPINLPTDRPGKKVQTFRGAAHTFNLDDELARRIKSLGTRRGATLYTTLLSSFQVLLHAISGQEELLICSPLTNRRSEEMKGVVGFFHNPLVLRTSIGGDPTFTEFLRHARQNVEEALANSAFPFSLLVERLRPSRVGGRSPLAQVMFVLYEASGQDALPFLSGEPGARIKLGGLELEYVELERQAAMLDLTLTAVEAHGSLTFTMEYNTDLFDESTIAGLALSFERLLEAIADDPSQPLSVLVRTIGRGGRRMSIRQVSSGGRAEDEKKVREMDFSLFYFASDDRSFGREKYRLLLDGARFADEHGFKAVWTPERHFHAFGGPYPNPSVTGAAIAAITERVEIRAGSVVLPLHNPVRVAEEWSVVDNLSNGRAGISVASGWHADDFVFAPHNYADRKQVMVRQVEILRRLWRGDQVTFSGVEDEQVEVKLLPRPVQPELPIWLTAFGSVETFRAAGETGANLLTHLLGQSIEMLAEKIDVYRAALRACGNDSAPGQVTVMLHTFIGTDINAVREKVRRPFCNYLKSSLNLLVGLAQGSGLSIAPEDLTPQTLDAVVNHAFNRYFDTSGLFGTPASCLGLIDRLKRAGVDEIACLIDFGVDTDSVLESLYHLKTLKEACAPPAVKRERESERRPVARFKACSLDREQVEARAKVRRSLTMQRSRAARDINA